MTTKQAELRTGVVDILNRDISLIKIVDNLDSLDTVDDLLALFDTTMQGIIGEDDKIDYSFINIPEEHKAEPENEKIIERNILRAEQRKLVTQIVGKK